jgi:hypothetical protein
LEITSPSTFSPLSEIAPTSYCLLSASATAVAIIVRMSAYDNIVISAAGADRLELSFKIPGAVIIRIWLDEYVVLFAVGN